MSILYRDLGEDLRPYNYKLAPSTFCITENKGQYKFKTVDCFHHSFYVDKILTVEDWNIFVRKPTSQTSTRYKKQYIIQHCPELPHVCIRSHQPPIQFIGVQLSITLELICAYCGIPAPIGIKTFLMLEKLNNYAR